MLGLDGGALASLAGLIGGAVLGLAARSGRFCMMGAVEDAVYGGDLARLRMLGVAAAMAIAGTQALAAAGGLDPDATLYLRSGWSPMAAVIGGLMFGYGMAQVGTCGFGALARLGGGDLRSLVMIVVIGVAGYATLAGPLAWVRTLLAPPGIMAEGHLSVAAVLGDAIGTGAALPGLAIAVGVAALALADRSFRRERAMILWGIAAGLTIPFAWGMTAEAGATGFDIVPVQSFSFVAPLGESVLYIMTVQSLALPDFAIASVAGVLAGAAAGSLGRGEFRWEACDDARELRRQIGGAAMMGVGGVLALGCSIGQGLSALSVLSVSAPVVIVSIFAGARIGLFLLVEGKVASR